MGGIHRDGGNLTLTAEGLMTESVSWPEACFWTSGQCRKSSMQQMTCGPQSDTMKLENLINE